MEDAGDMNSAANGAAKASIEKNGTVDDNVRSWGADALSQFRSSSWEDVVYTCTKILDIPGQSETNYDVLFQMGYASMRLGDYGIALEHFMRAHRIDSRRVALRLAICDLRMMIAMRPFRKRSVERGARG